MDQALAIARRAQRILLAGHLRADGDCLGSEGVLYHAFKQLGKDVRIMNPDAPDGRYGFLEQHTPFEVYAGPDSLPDYDALFVCDTSTLKRLGGMGKEVAQRPGLRVAVDHHVLDASDRESWHALAHDVGAPATGLLALDFARELGVTLPKPALEAAFVALSTDTGWFRYPNSGADAWRAAAELVELGVEPHRLYREIYLSCDAGRPKGIAAALATIEYFRDGRVAVAWLTQERLAESGGTLEDTDEILDVMRAVKEVDLAAFVLERAPGLLKASLRSKNAADVNKVARTLGGGGHARAAGVNFPMGTAMPTAVEALRDALLVEFDEKHAEPRAVV